MPNPQHYKPTDIGEQRQPRKQKNRNFFPYVPQMIFEALFRDLPPGNNGTQQLASINDKTCKKIYAHNRQCQRKITASALFLLAPKIMSKVKGDELTNDNSKRLFGDSPTACRRQRMLRQRETLRRTMVRGCVWSADAVFSRRQPEEWLLPRNWRSQDDNPAAPHVYRVPCDYDSAVFPPDSSFGVRLPQEPVVVHQISLHGQSSAYWSLSCVFIGYYPTPGSYGIRNVFHCKSAIGSEACRAGLITCDPIAKSGRKREIPEKNPPTHVIVQHDSHMQKSGSNHVRNRARFAAIGGEQSDHFTTAAPIRTVGVSIAMLANRTLVSGNTETNITGVPAVVDISSSLRVVLYMSAGLKVLTIVLQCMLGDAVTLRAGLVCSPDCIRYITVRETRGRTFEWDSSRSQPRKSVGLVAVVSSRISYSDIIILDDVLSQEVRWWYPDLTELDLFALRSWMLRDVSYCSCSPYHITEPKRRVIFLVLASRPCHARVVILDVGLPQDVCKGSRLPYRSEQSVAPSRPLGTAYAVDCSQDVSSEDWTNFLLTEAGERQFVAPEESREMAVAVTASAQCYNPSGCSCMAEAAQREVCRLQEPLCGPPPNCFSPVRPLGHCCHVCGESQPSHLMSTICQYCCQIHIEKHQKFLTMQLTGILDSSFRLSLLSGILAHKLYDSWKSGARAWASDSDSPSSHLVMSPPAILDGVDLDL
ncbi:hypothetical protein PR048_010525 [Dryococelus australis]|uniref:Protein amnionless n=1 Tax=Dryococelus australis TaxID=614101 RepID=A0ABQ9I2Z3_9NEOP|nr:hypothetical protein PR048_010525 [Dryococelus australis]